MFETNTQTNSALISLSRAAQLTGYHQDYLGQLCRLGKLPAQKVGRNWFTFPDALRKLSASEVSLVDIGVDANVGANTDEESSDDLIAKELHHESVVNSFEYSEPQVSQNITVSQVEGLPIAIRTVAVPARRVNTVQNVLTTIRINLLQQEVSELRQMLVRLMSEVSKHADLLQNYSAVARLNQQASDQLKHSYISNFDFNTPLSRINIMSQDEPVADEKHMDINQSAAVPIHHHHFSILNVLGTTLLAIIFALVTYSIVSGHFFGATYPQVSTIYYHPELGETPLQPSVAGDTLPTVEVGQ